MKYFLFIIIFLFFSLGKTFSQVNTAPKDTLDYFDLSLEQLLSLKAHGVSSELEALINQLISVASKKPLSARESPSIVSLITAEEIRNSGARDLIDVLRLVPGIDFGVDVYGVVGIGMRGNWAHEGKVLVLLDGQEMNEVMYGNNEFGNHFAVDQIKKIEIIRGPGSAIYGGFAEYGVVNIITKSGEDINGVTVTGTYGQMGKTFARRNLNISAGKKIKNTEINLSAFSGQGNRSDQTYTDIYGSSYNMAGNSKLNPTNINIGIVHKGLSFRGIIDKYNMTTQDAYDAITTQPYGQNFDSYFAEFKYIYKAKNEKLTITPRFNFKRQQPWASTEGFTESGSYLRRADRYRGNLTASYNFSRKINFVAGAEIFNDYATDLLRNHLPDSIPGGYFYSRDVHGNILDSSKTVQYYNYAYFAQGLIKLRLVNLIVGARYDQSNAFGSAFVPRVGLTKKFKKVNFKLLYSNSFRAPTIEDIDKFQNRDTNSTSGIKPEKTAVVELELGYQLTRNSIFTANFYDITTKDPIIYNVNNSEDVFLNYGKTGTRGVEVEYRVKEKWGYVNLNYSFYTTAGKNLNDSSYMVPDHPNVHLTFPAHRANLNSCYYFTKNFSASASLSFFGDRYGYVDTLSIHTFKPTVMLNVFVNYNNLFVKGLNLGLGVYDVADEKYQFIQPYNSGPFKHAPLPGPSREFIVKLCYEFKSGAKTNK